MRKAFEEQLADNLDVLAGAMRTGHSTMGALSVMVDALIEPSEVRIPVGCYGMSSSAFRSMTR